MMTSIATGQFNSQYNKLVEVLLDQEASQECPNKCQTKRKFNMPNQLLSIPVTTIIEIKRKLAALMKIGKAKLLKLTVIV